MQTTNGTPADDERDPVTGESVSEGYTPPQDAPVHLRQGDVHREVARREPLGRRLPALARRAQNT